jgi:hypothetical protein
MANRRNRILLFLLLALTGGALLSTSTAVTVLEAEAQSPAPAPSATTPAAPAPANPQDDEELARMFKEDQSDRAPLEKDGKPIDWSVVAKRDEARLARVKELYAAGRLRTGADHYHAAMVLQHAQAPEDFLLAHELCVVAIGKGEERAKWLAAARQDR